VDSATPCSGVFYQNPTLANVFASSPEQGSHVGRFAFKFVGDPRRQKTTHTEIWVFTWDGL